MNEQQKAKWNKAVRIGAVASGVVAMGASVVAASPVLLGLSTVTTAHTAYRLVVKGREEASKLAETAEN